MIHYGITVRYVTRRSMLENTFEVFSSAIKHHGPLYDYMRDDTKHSRVLRAGSLSHTAQHAEQLNSMNALSRRLHSVQAKTATQGYFMISVTGDITMWRQCDRPMYPLSNFACRNTSDQKGAQHYQPPGSLGTRTLCVVAAGET